MGTVKMYIHKDVHQALRMTTKIVDTDPTVSNTGENLKSNAYFPPNMRKGKTPRPNNGNILQ